MSQVTSANLGKALDCVTDAVLVLDRDGRFTYVNASAERLLGRPREELVGSASREVLSEGVGEEAERRLRASAARGDAVEYDALTPRSGRWLTVRAFPSEAEVVVYLRDVTLLRIITEAGAVLGASLATDETLGALTRLVVPRMGDSCIVDLTDDDGGLRRVAAAYRDAAGVEFMLGLGSPGPIQDREVGVYKVARTGVAELVPAVDDAWLAAAMREEAYLKVVRSGRPPRSMIVVPFRSRDRVLGVLTICMVEGDRRYGPLDLAAAEAIADRAALAIENARLFEQTVQAKRLREDVLGVVSHDLRGPLAVIALNAHALARKIDAREVRAIERAVPRADALVADLLTAAVLDAGALPLDRHPDDVRAVVEDAVDLQRSRAADRSVWIEVTSSGEVPLVSIDRHRVLAVLGNLLDNALRFTPEGGHVRVDVRAGEGGVAVDVSDTGPGISPENQAHLFDRFWQGSRTHRAGAGLGLAIAKGIVEAHHGSLRVESAPGRGATFTVVLPVDA